MNKPRLILLVGLLWMFSGSAEAQTFRVFQDDLANVIKSARLHFGPFRLKPGFSVRSIGYDDNIYYGDTPRSDVTATLSPRVTAYLPFRRSLYLWLEENPEYAFYARVREGRALTNSLGVGGKALILSRFVLSGRYRHDSRRQNFTSEIGWLGLRTTEFFETGLSWETPRKTSFGFRAYWSRDRYEDLSTSEGLFWVSRTLNRSEHGTAADLYYLLRPETYLFLEADFCEYLFAEEAARYRDGSSVEMTGGIQFPLLRALQGTLSLGYMVITPRDPTRDGYRGLTGETGLSFRKGRLGVNLGFERKPTFSIYGEYNHYVDTRVTAGTSFYATRFLKLNYDFNVGWLDYPVLPGEAIAGDVSGRRERQQSHVFAFLLRVKRRTGVGLTWTTGRWSSTRLDTDRRRNFLGLVIAQDF